MGYDLSNESGTYVRFTGSGWDLALAVAKHYGWQPAGTPKPSEWDVKKHGAWDDGYWANAGQQVTAGDAAALADALERAIVASDLAQVVGRIWQSIGDSSHEDPERFRGRLTEFHSLARQGSFRIE